MSRQNDSHYGGTVTVHWNIPGLGIMIATAATSAAAGTVGYAPGAKLLTTTTKKEYTNTGTYDSATWTVTGDQTA